MGFACALGDEIVAELAVPLHRQIEIAVADQLAIAEFARRIAGHGDDAVGDFEPVGRDAEPRRGHLEEHAARLGRGVAQGDAALLHPGAAARTTLVDGPWVSPITTLTRANGTSSSSATIWAIATSTPWPMSILPK
mgnify:CR=1 FL=1